MYRHIKREKVSLPVDVRRSKTSLFKLPNINGIRARVPERASACSHIRTVASALFPDGAKLRRADLELEASHIG